MTRYSARVAAARLSGRRRAFPVAKPSRRAASIGAAPAYLERHGTPRGVDELRRHAVVAYLRAGSPQPWDVVDVDGQIRRAQIQPQFGFDDMTGIVDAVLAGVGLGVATGLATGSLCANRRAGDGHGALFPADSGNPSGVAEEPLSAAENALVAWILPMIGAPTAGAPGSQDA